MTTNETLLFQADMMIELNQTGKISESKLTEFKTAFAAIDDVHGMMLPLIMIMEQNFDEAALTTALAEVAKVFTGIDVAKYTALVRYISKNRHGEYAVENYQTAITAIDSIVVDNIYLQIAVETEKLRMYIGLKDYANISISATNLRALQEAREAAYGQVIMYGEL